MRIKGRDVLKAIVQPAFKRLAIFINNVSIPQRLEFAFSANPTS